MTMPKTIDQTRFTSELFDLLDETFENHHGIYFDRGPSLSETLAGVSAAEASRPVGASVRRWRRRLPMSRFI